MPDSIRQRQEGWLAQRQKTRQAIEKGRAGQVNEIRFCRICGVDITSLHFNRIQCHDKRCIAKQRAEYNARRNKSTSSTNRGQRYATQRSFNAGGYEVQPLQMYTPKMIRSSGGLNVGKDVLEQQRRDEWARAIGRT